MVCIRGTYTMRSLVLALALSSVVLAVDRSKFRTCDSAGFCKRHRGKTSEPALKLRADTVSLNVTTATVTAAVDVAGAPHLDLYLHLYASGLARLRLAESDGKQPRWQVCAADS